MFEFESGKLAVVRADAATKTFNRQMLMDHEKTTGELKAS
jgi:predicted outer membrane protein